MFSGAYLKNHDGTVNDTARINLPGGNQNLESRDHLSIDKGSNINWQCVKWIPVSPRPNRPHCREKRRKQGTLLD
jgi:hypothetical protein